uniref:V-type proton ATPase subunit S1-like n=1 Tax=Salmo trutta TaxID=8032 RepID=A0A673Y8M0_SALTR
GSRMTFGFLPSWWHTLSSRLKLKMWSGLPSQAVPAAGHIVGISQLSSYLETALGSAPPNVLLFLQDKMSIEDFTMYGGAFGNKQDSAFPNLEDALLSSPSPLVLPAVAWPASSAVIGQLQDQLDTSPLYMEPETLSQLRLNASTPALLVFRLPYSTGSDLMSAKEVLNENDEVIGQVMSIMKSQSVPYTAVYTAMRPSRVSVCLSMSLTNHATACSERPTLDNLSLERSIKSETQCCFLSRASVISFKTFMAAVIVLCFFLKPDWYIDKIELVYKNSFSWSLTRIQGFNVAGGEFSYASDCAGFFSPGIWMGLLTSLLMLVVLTYGLHMIMQLHTMDRFDDPKGPAISVPQTD